MSNCINIHTPRLFLTANEIDIAALREVTKRDDVRANKTPAWWGDVGYDEDVSIAWWYLNADFINDAAVNINFGAARSSHTWRDFRCFCNWLGKFMKVEKTLYFTLSDEHDGFKTRFKQKVVLKPGSAEVA